MPQGAAGSRHCWRTQCSQPCCRYTSDGFLGLFVKLVADLVVLFCPGGENSIKG